MNKSKLRMSKFVSHIIRNKVTHAVWPQCSYFPYSVFKTAVLKRESERRKGRRRKTASENEKLVQMFWNKWHTEYNDLIGVYFDHILTVNRQDLNNLKILKPSYQYYA